MAHRKIGTRPRSRRAEPVSATEADTTQLPSATDHPIIASERLLALFAAQDLDAIIDTAFEVLRAAVVCDFATAFYRSGGDGLLKARDSRGRRYGVQLMRRHVELNPAIPLALANRGVKVLATRMGLPRSNKELRRTAFYREIMEPLGWRHSVALCFWGNPPAEVPVFVISADRSEGQSDFSDHEVAALTGLHPFLDCAVNRLHEREAAATVHDSIAMAMRWNARIRHSTATCFLCRRIRCAPAMCRLVDDELRKRRTCLRLGTSRSCSKRRAGSCTTSGNLSSHTGS